jgi:membrane protease YdiL (CAAX protease family)
MRAAAWAAAAAFAPVAASWFFTGMFIGGWYAWNRHTGAPPTGVIAASIFASMPPAEWGAAGLVALLWYRRASLAELFATRTRGLSVDLAAGGVIGLAWALWYGLGGVVGFERMVQVDAWKLISMPASVGAGFCEELICRGFIFYLVARAGGGTVAQILWSSVAFGLAHVLWGWQGMLWTFFLGLTFGALRAWRGSVWPAVTAHTVLNLLIEPGLLLGAMAMSTAG